MALVSVWLREGRLLVVPSGGHGLDIEPLASLDVDPQALGSALRAALEASAASPADLAPPPKGWKSPALKAAGVRSYAKLYAGASLCLVVEDEGALCIERWQPARDGRGFEAAEHPQIPVEVAADLAAQVIAALGVASGGED